MDKLVASNKHGIMILQIQLDRMLTASSPLNKLDALTTGHIETRGLHPCKYAMIILLKHADKL